MDISRCKICEGELYKFIDNKFDDRHGYPGRFDIYRCKKCGFGQTFPVIPETQIGEIYTKYYPRKKINIENIKKNPVKLINPIKRWWLGVNNTAHYHIKKGKKVLDIGCGDCTSIREINEMGSEGYGIEPDQNIKFLVEKLGLKVHIGLFNEINFPEKFFDYITMSQVLEHIHNPIELLISLKPILKDDGQIIIGVPNIDSRLRKKYGSKWLNWHIPYHINHFSQKSLFILSNKSGYKLKKIKTYTPNLWVSLQKKLLNYPIKEGEKVPFFDPYGKPDLTQLNYEKKKDNPFSALIKNTKLNMYLNIIEILFLRLNDLLRKGESFLVFLVKD